MRALALARSLSKYPSIMDHASSMAPHRTVSSSGLNEPCSSMSCRAFMAISRARLPTGVLLAAKSSDVDAEEGVVEARAKHEKWSCAESRAHQADHLAALVVVRSRSRRIKNGAGSEGGEPAPQACHCPKEHLPQGRGSEGGCRLNALRRHLVPACRHKRRRRPPDSRHDQ